MEPSQFPPTPKETKQMLPLPQNYFFWPWKTRIKNRWKTELSPTNLLDLPINFRPPFFVYPKQNNIIIKYGIGATIRISRKIQYLPYAGFFLEIVQKSLTRGRVDASTAHIFFLLDKSRKLSKNVSVQQSAWVERFNVSRMRDF